MYLHLENKFVAVLANVAALVCRPQERVALKNAITDGLDHGFGAAILGANWSTWQFPETYF